MNLYPLLLLEHQPQSTLILGISHYGPFVKNRDQAQSLLGGLHTRVQAVQEQVVPAAYIFTFRLFTPLRLLSHKCQ